MVTIQLLGGGQKLFSRTTQNNRPVENRSSTGFTSGFRISQEDVDPSRAGPTLHFRNNFLPANGDPLHCDEGETGPTGWKRTLANDRARKPYLMSAMEC